MLNNVPAQVNRSVRLVTLRHPNAMDCSVFRKTITRDPSTGEMGGLPNIGGAGLLDGEDEANYEYDKAGDAKILFAGIFEGTIANWNDAKTAAVFGDNIPVLATIECVLEPTEPEFIFIQKDDIISVEPGAGVVLTYQVIGETSPTSIPPYTKKFILAQRADSTFGIA